MNSSLKILVVVVVVFFAGCTTPQSTTPPPAAPETPQQIGNTTAPSSLPPTALVGSPVHSESLSLGADSFTFSGPPVRTSYPNTWTILKNTGYESAYDETFRNPAWVAYHLSGPVGTTAPRSSGYPTDPRSTAGVTATDYPPSYDHGHMAPNEAIAVFFSDAAQAETFLMTNMVPQKPGLNRGPWKALETLEYSKWEQEFHDVWVIDSPVYTTADGQPINPSNRYGAKQVCIPVACFKVIWVKDAAGNLNTLAFIMPQDPGTGHKPKEYLTSIREIERRTGLNFNASWTTAKQDLIEKTVASDLWP